jgi:hypothetical protein
VNFTCIRHRCSFPGEWQKAYGLDHPTPSSARLKMGPTVSPITCIPFYSMNFNIYYDDDDYY